MESFVKKMFLTSICENSLKNDPQPLVYQELFIEIIPISETDT